MLLIYFICVTLFLVEIFYLLYDSKWKKKPKRLPPGPKSLPILGNLHMVGKNTMHKDLYHLAKRYGPIMSMRLGFVPTIIVSSPEAAEKFLKTHDLVFASRPHHEAAWYVAYEQRNLTFAPYGTYWRNMRRFCTQELLSKNKVNSFQSMRTQELELLVQSLNRASLDHAVVDLTAAVSSLIGNMSCLMVFGKKYINKDFDDRGFKDVIQETMRLAAIPNLGDFFPFLGILDIQGLNRRLKALAKVFDGFLEKIIHEHVQSDLPQKSAKNFVDTMMAIMRSGEADFEFDTRHVKSILLDLLIASMDTSAIAIEWTLSELLRHPEVMKKLQKELEDKIGRQGTVEESDLDRLEYLDMVVKEALRLHPVAPLLVREATEDCSVDDFYIQKKSRIVINIWAIMQNPNVWWEPEKFIPERFQGNNIDVQGHDFRLVPFGAGRRSCPGLQLGLLTIRLVVAQLVHCFNWELPNGMVPSDLDMSEVFGLLTGRAKHLRAIPSYRLQK